MRRKLIFLSSQKIQEMLEISKNEIKLLKCAKGHDGKDGLRLLLLPPLCSVSSAKLVSSGKQKDEFLGDTPHLSPFFLPLHPACRLLCICSEAGCSGSQRKSERRVVHRLQTPSSPVTAAHSFNRSQPCLMSLGVSFRCMISFNSLQSPSRLLL